MSVLQSLGAPAGVLTDSPPSCKPERLGDENADNLTSDNPVPSSVTKHDDSASCPANDLRSASPSKELPSKDTLMNGFPPPSNCESQDDEDFGDFGDFRTVPNEVELRKSVVEEESDPEQERRPEVNSESDKDDAFDDFQQADSNDSERSIAQSPANELTEVDRHQLQNDTADFGAFSTAPESVVETEQKETEEDDFDAFQGGQSRSGAQSSVVKEESSKEEEEEDFDAFQSGKPEEFGAFHQEKETEEKEEEEDDGFGTFRAAIDKKDNDEGEEFDTFKESKAEDDEFSGFQTLREGNTAEDADFGGFQTLQEGNTAEDGDFGDFADFAQADNAFNAFKESPPSQQDTQGGFGDFSQSDSKATEEKIEEPIGFPAFEGQTSKDAEPSSLLVRTWVDF